MRMKQSTGRIYLSPKQTQSGAPTKEDSGKSTSAVPPKMFKAPTKADTQAGIHLDFNQFLIRRTTRKMAEWGVGAAGSEDRGSWLGRKAPRSGAGVGV